MHQGLQARAGLLQCDVIITSWCGGPSCSHKDASSGTVWNCRDALTDAKRQLNNNNAT